MRSAKAFAPGNISCIFVIKKIKNPAKSGSLGMGFTVNKGVIAAVKKINNDEKYNNKKNSYNEKTIKYKNCTFPYNSV